MDINRIKWLFIGKKPKVFESFRKKRQKSDILAHFSEVIPVFFYISPHFSPFYIIFLLIILLSSLPSYYFFGSGYS